ncbi:hypothetical protein [Acidovorax carolinensis]|nr:hypothetical protein [Acidovorax carolinensis]
MIKLLHHEIRDAIRATGCSASAVAIQCNVDRSQMAALLRGADNCTLRTLSIVTLRLGRPLCLSKAKIEQYLPSLVETVVDRAIARIAAG